ncbi:MAG: tyrosine-type recombinase/integrase [Gemmatimonadota bacterium]
MADATTPNAAGAFPATHAPATNLARSEVAAVGVTVTHAATPMTQPSTRHTRASRTSQAKDEATRRLKKRNGRYYLDLRDLGKGREALIPEGQSYATKDPLVAMALAGARLEQVLRPEHEQYFGRHAVKHPTSIGAWARRWLEQAKERAGDGYASLKTIRRYEQALAQLLKAPIANKPAVKVPIAEEPPVQEPAANEPAALDQDMLAHHVAKSDVKRALQTLRKRSTRSRERTSASSLHQIITAMGIIYDDAADEGIVPEGYNPWRALKRRERPSLPTQSRTEFLEIDEAHELLQACIGLPLTEIPLHAMLATYLYTGGRKAEVLGLEWKDIDFVAKTVRIAANTWRSIKDVDERTVPLAPQLETILRAFQAETGAQQGLVFPGTSTSGATQMITSYHKALVKAHRIAVARLRGRGWDIAANQLAEKPVNMRVMRVTYCSARLQTTDGGAPIAQWTVEREMGHSSAKMIRTVYGRIGERRRRSAHVEYVSRETMERDLAQGR